MAVEERRGGTPAVCSCGHEVGWHFDCCRFPGCPCPDGDPTGERAARMAALAGGVAALGRVTRASLDASTAGAVRLAAEDVEAIARRVAELIGPGARIGLVDVDEICRRFRVSRTWVYEHARELGAIPLGQTGGGRRPRLRFDLERATRAIEQMSGEHDATVPRQALGRPQKAEVPVGVKLIQPRGSAA